MPTRGDRCDPVALSVTTWSDLAGCGKSPSDAQDNLIRSTLRQAASGGGQVGGADEQTGALFSYLSPEALVPKDHPLRSMRRLVNAALERLSGKFDMLYAVS